MRKRIKINKKRTARFFSAVFSIILASSTLNLTAFASDTNQNGKTVIENNLTVSGYVEEDAHERVHGYIDDGYRVPSLTENMSESEMDGIVQASNIPSNYDSRDYGNVTDIKYQGTWGTCWAFAATAAMESSALSQRLVADKSDIDLSEYNLVYMTFDDSGYVDPIGGTNGDSTTTKQMYSCLMGGGNDEMAFKTMSRWEAIVNEADAPYKSGTTIPSFTYNADKLSYILTGLYQVSMKDSDYVKLLIKENGAVTSSYYDSDSYTDSTHTYIYNDVTSKTNHAIAIIGWDDNISKNKFAITDSSGVTHTPEGNGAWLIKNSWGSWYGDSGYMWISYYDVSMSNSDATAYIISTADTYDYNYQYDGNTFFNYGYTDGNGNNYFSGKRFANVFTVPEGTGKQNLDSVSFATREADCNYSIQIYKNPSLDSLDNLSAVDDPESGTPLLSTPITGTTTYPGYYTVDIPSAIQMQEGDTFAVVISFPNRGSLEYSMGTANIYSYTTSKNTLGNNESYYSKYGGTLSDMYEDSYYSQYNINFAIKAFTTKAAEEPPKPELKASLSINGSTGQLNLVAGGTVNLAAGAVGGSGSYTYQYTMKNVTTGANIILKNYSSSTSYSGPLTSTGTKQFAVNVKDSEGTVVESNIVTVVVNANTSNLEGNLTVNGNVERINLIVGETVNLAVSATGGSGKYTYQYQMKNAANGATYTLKNYSSSTAYSGPLTSAGTKLFTVNVKDSNGVVVASNTVTVIVSSSGQALLGELLANGSSDNVNLAVGDTVKLTAKASGGKGSYTYQYVMKNMKTGTTAVLKNYSSSTTFSGPLTSAGTKQFTVNVKDSAGMIVASNTVTVVVSNEPVLSASLKINNSIGQLNLSVGGTVKLTVSAAGGSGSYTYQYVMKNVKTGATVILKNYSSSTSYSGPLTSAGTKQFIVNVKDSTGAIVSSNMVTAVVS